MANQRIEQLRETVRQTADKAVSKGKELARDWKFRAVGLLVIAGVAVSLVAGCTRPQSTGPIPAGDSPSATPTTGMVEPTRMSTLTPTATLAGSPAPAIEATKPVAASATLTSVTPAPEAAPNAARGQIGVDNVANEVNSTVPTDWEGFVNVALDGGRSTNPSWCTIPGVEFSAQFDLTQNRNAVNKLIEQGKTDKSCWTGRVLDTMFGYGTLESAAQISMTVGYDNARKLIEQQFSERSLGNATKVSAAVIEGNKAWNMVVRLAIDLSKRSSSDGSFNISQVNEGIRRISSVMRIVNRDPKTGLPDQKYPYPVLRSIDEENGFTFEAGSFRENDYFIHMGAKGVDPASPQFESAGQPNSPATMPLLVGKDLATGAQGGHWITTAGGEKMFVADVMQQNVKDTSLLFIWSRYSFRKPNLSFDPMLNMMVVTNARDAGSGELCLNPAVNWVAGEKGAVPPKAVPTVGVMPPTPVPSATRGVEQPTTPPGKKEPTATNPPGPKQKPSPTVDLHPDPQEPTPAAPTTPVINPPGPTQAAGDHTPVPVPSSAPTAINPTVPPAP